MRFRAPGALVARNPEKLMPNYQLRTNADFQETTERVGRSAKYQSRIVLPVMSRRRRPPTRIEELRGQLSIDVNRRAASDTLFLSMPVD